MKRIAILQSNYIPWKGVFDMMNMVDTFVFYDDVQFTKQDWRSRNRIKTSNGVLYLTVPCGKDVHRLINEVRLQDQKWQKQHWKTIEQSYKKAPFFELYRTFLEEFYLHKQWTSLSEMNQWFTKTVAKEFLGITTECIRSEDLGVTGASSERIERILEHLEATVYLSGPAAKSYLNTEALTQMGIETVWMDYSGYKEYDQLHPPFDHFVSIIDTLVHLGPSTKDYLLSFS